MTSRGPGRASRTPEMEEKEQLRRQIRLLQGLIDDYKNLHGGGSAPGVSAPSRWQPPAYSSSRAFSAGYPRPSRRGFSPNRGPAWRKKYSLVNRPPASSDQPGDGAVQTPLRAGDSQGPDPQQYVLERQVQLSSDQNMVIKIKPPSKPGSANAAGVPRGSLEEFEGPPWSNHRPQEGEGEPLGAQRQLPKPGRVKGSCGSEDPGPICQKEAGKPRVVKSAGSVSDSPSEPRRTVSASAVAVKTRFPSSTLPRRGGVAVGRKLGSHSVSSCVAHLLGDGRVSAGHADQPASSGTGASPARPASGPRQARESSLPVPCRTAKFRKNNYKWVAASAKSARAPRRALSPRAASELVCKAPCGTAEQEKPQLGADPDARPRRSAASSTAGASPSKYKWKASSPSASSSSSFRWQSEAGSKDHASQLSPVPSRSPPGDRAAVGPSSLKPPFGETPLSAYKVRSRTKIVRRRAVASLPGDKKSSPPPAATAKSQFSLRRRQALRGKSSPVPRRTPSKGLMQVTRQRLCCPLPGRAHLPGKEASGPHALRSPPAGREIKTRYRIVKKTPASPLSAPQAPLALPSWRARRLSLSRSLVLNRLRPAAGGGKGQTSSPRWRSRGFRCIGGILYKVSANKLSKTCGRPGGDSGNRPLLRTGRGDPAGSCSRSLASRAVQRSLAIVRQARQRRRKQQPEYCMYYNRFGRCHHGQRCPYIHDPDKVAVCTRFLRGTCKKTDGTCPFSHHVSKEKMPVCSYFLKGICSNSNCPYSHVYVSRKAEVCTDFLKGYCPLGAKAGTKSPLLSLRGGHVTAATCCSGPPRPRPVSSPALRSLRSSPQPLRTRGQGRPSFRGMSATSGGWRSDTPVPARAVLPVLPPRDVRRGACALAVSSRASVCLRAALGDSGGSHAHPMLVFTAPHDSRLSPSLSRHPFLPIEACAWLWPRAPAARPRGPPCWLWALGTLQPHPTLPAAGMWGWEMPVCVQGPQLPLDRSQAPGHQPCCSPALSRRGRCCLPAPRPPHGGSGPVPPAPRAGEAPGSPPLHGPSCPHLVLLHTRSHVLQASPFGFKVIGQVSVPCWPCQWCLSFG
ncbi:zinc finger CCCH domain-containing protein 3 isoform X1 [Mustela lutreola]|uniref:zinc finger CCCH domain-containing protein 3 isoform X1 n=1 Tax=Mustela lutreola TaxID=9666 RepID=UPI002797B735|nr:zinc finger CCCH domain-containing protein 3 isoform X1 [Mustela lutreola]